MRRWRTPVAVDQEDVEQELRMAGWAAVASWDPGRNVPIDRYVTFQAIDKAKKWMHRQRDALRRDDKAPGRFAITLASMRVRHGAEADMEPELDRFAWEQADAVDRIEQRQAIEDGLALLEEAAIGLDRLERACIAALLAQGDLSAAIASIVADPGLRLVLRTDDVKDVETSVRRSVRRAVDELRN